MNNYMPIVRLEVESMRLSILHAFSNQMLQMDDNLKIAVDNFCTPENIQRIMNGEVERVMREVIQEELVKFYRHGEGRQIIAEKIKKNILEGHSDLL